MTQAKDDFLPILEKGVRDVLADKKATTEQKIQAITAGSRLLQIRHKVLDSSGESEHFFNKGK